MKRHLIFFCCIAICSQNVWAKRYALLIGNSDYVIGALKNPVNDATDMAALLESKHFQVTVLTNASQREMDQAINQFSNQLLEKEAVGLFYFAGHGIEVDGRNYLVPVDADVNSETDVKYDTVDVGRVLDGMERAGNNLNLLILDACRNNPYARSFRSSTRGLARMDAAKGSLVLYATSPGDVALDGEGRNGLFTSYLMEAIKVPNLSVEKVFKKTANDVYDFSKGKQLPWQTGVILGEFYFSQQVPEKKFFPPDTVPQVGRKEENLYWDSIKNETHSAYFESYIDRYPDGIYIDLARLKIDIKEPIIENKPIMAHLTINVDPTDAKVRILNIVPKFRQGMRLTPGRYKVEVSRSGYQKHIEWIELSEDVSHQVALVKAPTLTMPLPKARLHSASGFVTLPGGCFNMGSPKTEKGRDSDEAQHQVCLKSFKIASKEVTVGDFRQFVKASGYHTDAERHLKQPGCYAYNSKDRTWKWRAKLFWDAAGYPQNDQHPVSCVSWNDAQAYVKWINKTRRGHYRLPTEAEWEYAARSGSKTAFFWGNVINQPACRYANVADRGHHWSINFKCNDGYKFTAPTGHFLANKFGLYDMIGNVSEWTCSKATRRYTGDEKICLNNTTKKQILVEYRGGSFYDRPQWSRAANRNKLAPWERNYFVGFRLVRIN